METGNIIQIALATTGIINCFIVSTLLFFIKKGYPKANYILSILSFAMLLKMCYALLINIPHQWKTPSLMVYYFSEAGYLSFGPLLYLYIRTFLKKQTKTIVTILLFIIPLSPFIGHFFEYDIPLWIMQSYYFIFLILLFFLIRSYYIKEKKSTQLKSQLFWIKTLYISFIFIWLSVNLLFIDFKLFFFELSIIFTVVFYIDLYLAIKHYWLKKGDENKSEKYVNSKISEEEAGNIIEKLKQLMLREKIYIDSEISLPRVASQLKISPHKLSQVINHKLQMTFNEYINQYRVNEIKNIIKLPDYKNLKIASIAYDYGFNSISVFNTAFKKFTNCTPSQYRSKNLIENEL